MLVNGQDTVTMYANTSGNADARYGYALKLVFATNLKLFLHFISDLIVQAKSGTGKTCVFAVIALEGHLNREQFDTGLYLSKSKIRYRFQMSSHINYVDLLLNPGCCISSDQRDSCTDM